MGAYSHRNVVVGAEDDDLGEDITDANVEEDVRVVERNLARHWTKFSQLFCLLCLFNARCIAPSEITRFWTPEFMIKGVGCGGS